MEETKEETKTFEEMLTEWEEVERRISVLQRRQAVLSEALFTGAFPKPKLGVNSVDLKDGRRFKATHKLNAYIPRGNYDALLDAIKKTGFNGDISELVDIEYKWSNKKIAAARPEVAKAVRANTNFNPAKPKLEVV